MIMNDLSVGKRCVAGSKLTLPAVDSLSISFLARHFHEVTGVGSDLKFLSLMTKLLSRYLKVKWIYLNISSAVLFQAFLGSINLFD